MILRNTVKHMILKKGITEKNIRLLRMIHTAESYFSECLSPTDISVFSNEILSRVFIKKTEKNLPFEFCVSDFKNVFINKPQYLTLILKLSQNSNGIFINRFKNGILINCKTENFKGSIPFIKKLDGTYFYEIKTSQLNILFSPQLTDKKPYKTPTDQEFFLGPLSVINLYLN